MGQVVVVVGAYPHTEALLNPQAERRSLVEEGVPFKFRSLADEPGAFSRMANGLEFDVCEMPIVSYLVARDRGVRITALPIFPTRGFDHRRIVVNKASGIRRPLDLEGRAVGVRYYGFTDGTWARAVLSESFGVDLDRISWVTKAPETVTSAELPPNVRHLPDADLVALLGAGDLDGLILDAGQQIDDQRFTPLISEPEVAERDWFAVTGVYPIHHTVVVRDELMEELPQISTLLEELFTSSKRALLERFASGVRLSSEEESLARTRTLLGDDPVPYGIEENRTALEMIVRCSFDQHLIRAPLDVDEVFPSR